MPPYSLSMVLTLSDVPAECIDRDVSVGDAAKGGVDALAIDYQPVMGGLFFKKERVLGPHSRLSPSCWKPASTRQCEVGHSLVTPRNILHQS
jgi:hypothetical protein